MFNSYVLTKENIKEDIIVYDKTDILPLKPLKFINSTSKRKPKLLAKAISLDTETSHNHEEDKEKRLGWIYQWAFKFNNNYYSGRTPSDLIQMLDTILDYYKCNTKHKIVLYIHNLSYDLTYIIDIFIQHYGEPVSSLITKANRWIQIEYERFVIRDSWVLANRSLDKWSKDLNTNYRKAIGEINYNEIRYQDSILSIDSDWYYQLSDVATLDDCINKELKSGGYNIQTIVLTSTGFVREYARKLYKKDSANYKLFQDTKLDEEIYNDLDFAYMGAMTHGNNDYMGELMEHINMLHRDKRSFYPSTQRKDGYPVGKWYRLYNYATDNRKISYKDVLKWSEANCLLITFYIEDITLLKGVTFPILQVNKCLRYRSEGSHFIKDNGKVVKMEGSTLLCLTDLDFKIMIKQYHIKKLIITKVNASKRGKLPKWLLDTIDKFMEAKSFYKEEVKKYEELGDINNIVESSINLMKSKNKLNGIYGMTATRPVRDEYHYNSDTMDYELEYADTQTALDKFYKSRNNFMSFQWGCFVTAWTRYRLLSMIAKDIGNDICEGIGYDKAIYCDTDSLFYLADEETERIYNNFNKKNYEECLNNGEYVKVGDKIIEYMTWELEPEHITSFKFLHSKCYGYICDNDPSTLKVTIAGVPKYYKEDLDKEPKDRRTREDELGSLENLSDGFIFTHCGGTGAVYTNTKPQIMDINGHKTELARACIITETTKTLKEISDSLIFWEE